MSDTPSTKTSEHLLVDPRSIEAAVDRLYAQRCEKSAQLLSVPSAGKRIKEAMQAEKTVRTCSPYVQLQIALSLMDDLEKEPGKVAFSAILQHRTKTFPHIFDPQPETLNESLETSLERRSNAIMEIVEAQHPIAPALKERLEALPKTLARIHRNQGQNWPGEAYMVLVKAVMDDAASRGPHTNLEAFDQDWNTGGGDNRWRQTVNHIDGRIKEIREAQALASEIPRLSAIGKA